MNRHTQEQKGKQMQAGMKDESLGLMLTLTQFNEQC